MNSTTLKSILWWVVAFVFTIMIAMYQKTTGPTYPVSGKAIIQGKEYKYKLIRTAENDKDARIAIAIPDTSVKAYITYKRYKSHDSLTTVSMDRAGDELVFMMPKQPAAGKMMYHITLHAAKEQVVLKAKDDDFVVMRFKGVVPLGILIPHIVFMFLSLLFSTRTAIEAFINGTKIYINGTKTYKLSIYTFLMLIVGGLILGPIVQKYAFGAYWTGWPFGHDLTDNKTLLMAVFWLIAMLKLRKSPNNKLWPILAAILTLVVFLIPHSVLGSEIDHTKTIN